MTSGHMSIAVLAAAAALLAALLPRAEAQDADLQKYLREVQREFTFEEQHNENTPINWHKVGSRGYPTYTRGRFDREVYHSPKTSFCCHLNGGNCAYEYEPRRIVIDPAFDYCLEGWIRTQGLVHSRAYLSIWFNDQQGRTIEGGKVRTDPVGGTTDWVRVHCYLSPASEDLAGRPRFADIAMEVLGHEAQDIGATVWFDDVRIYRIPRLRMTLAEDRLAFDQGHPVVIRLSADGLLARSFPGRVVVRDDRGDAVFDRKVTLVPGPDDRASSDVTLPELPPGAYHGSYDLAGDAPTILCRRVSFAVLAPRSGPEASRGVGFGLADPSGIDDPDMLVSTVAQLGVRTLKLPVWQAETTAAQMRLGSARLERVLGALRHSGMHFVGVFADPPLYLRAKTTESIRGVADLLAMKEDLWQQPVGFSMSRYSGVIASWQIGSDDDPSLIRLQTEPDLLARAARQMDRLSAGTPLGIPWPALYAVPRKLPPRIDFVALRIGPEILPDQIREYLAEQASENGPRVYLTLDPISTSRHDADDRILDFVSRVLAAKQAGVQEVFFSKLVDPEIGLLRRPEEPTELFIVARTLCDMLGGTRFAGWLPLEHDANAMVFERDDGSETVVIWTDRGPFQVTEPLYLGEALTQTDLWGNRSPIPRVGSVSRLTLPRMPVFISGIDPQISRTRRSFRLGDNRIPAAYRRHQTALTFTNAFSRGVSGRIRLRVPKGWNVDPALIKFNLAEGEPFTQPLSITVPYNETVGDKDFLAEFTVEAKAVYRFMAVARVRFEMASARTHAVVFQEGRNLVVEQEVTCTAARPTSYHAYLQIPGRPMRSHAMPRMQPGETVVKRYLVPYAPALEQETALVGVRDNTVDRGFANLLLPLGGVYANTVLHTSSAARPARPE